MLDAYVAEGGGSVKFVKVNEDTAFSNTTSWSVALCRCGICTD